MVRDLINAIICGIHGSSTAVRVHSIVWQRIRILTRRMVIGMLRFRMCGNQAALEPASTPIATQCT